MLTTSMHLKRLNGLVVREQPRRYSGIRSAVLYPNPYRGDDEVTAWLSQEWEPEELRHGAALRRYVETAWPEFDWNAAYRAFFAEYSRCRGARPGRTTAVPAPIAGGGPIGRALVADPGRRAYNA
jgi:hypothetical protein